MGFVRDVTRIPAISPGSIAQSTDTSARAMYTGGGSDDAHLAQSAHDRSMSPSFPPSGCSLEVLPLLYAGPPRHPPTPVIPHHAVVCTARCELPRCSPFLRTPLSSLPRLLARPTRAFAPVKEKTGAAQEEQEVGGSEERGEGGSGSGKKWREREMPMSRPRRSFCSPPPHPPGDFGEFSHRRYYALFFLLPFAF